MGSHHESHQGQSHGGPRPPDPPLIGRARELSLLCAALDGMGSGRGSLLLLAGEPGIGKSRLAHELAARARRDGAIVAWGAAWDGGGAPALWPWIQVVRVLRASLPGPDEGLRRALGPLWETPAGGGRGGDGEGADVDLSRFRRLDALRSLLGAAAARARLLVVIEDLHAADRASIEALQFVAQALPALPAVVVGTYRDPEARLDPELGDRIARAARGGTVLPLARLGRRETAELVVAIDPGASDLAGGVHEASGGNPLFAAEALRLLRAGAAPGRVPESVGALIRDRLARLSEPARRALGAAAVLGREADHDVLSEVCGLPFDALRHALRAVLLAGVVEEAGDGVLRFSHALFREALYRDLGEEQRADLHLRAGEALAARCRPGDTPAEEQVARHLLAALPRGDAARAVRWAVRAGAGARRSLAFDRAAGLLEGALRALDALPADAARRIDVSLELAAALARSGAAGRGRALCREAAAQARAIGDGVRLARAALSYGAELRHAAVDPVLVGLLEEALAAIGDADARLRALAIARLAAARQPAADPAAPVRQAREAIALARDAGDPATLIATLYSAGSAMVDYAPPAERLAVARELCALALARGELVLAQQGYARAAIDHLELGDPGGADLAIAAQERIGAALGHGRWLWRAALMRSMRALMEGRWEDSEREIARAASLGAGGEDSNAEAAVALHRLGALLARDAAPLDEGLAALDAALARVEWFPALGEAAARAALLARAGDAAGARRMLAAAPLRRPLFRADGMMLALAADAAVSACDRPAAEALLPAFEALKADRALSWGVFASVWGGPAALWRGALLAVLGRGGEAGDAGPALDDAAVRAYRQRVADLEEELHEADAWADTGRSGRLRAELELLRDEIGRGLGLGGRARRGAGAVERARVNVQKRLRGTVRKIAAALPDLGRHLDHEVRTGTCVSYRRDG